MMRSFSPHICEHSAKIICAMSSCPLRLLVQCCTRANFQQYLFQINLLMYAIFLIAILYKSYILFSSNVSCISIIYLHRLIILIVWLSVTNRYVKNHLLLNLDYFTRRIITNGERKNYFFKYERHRQLS